MARKPECVSVVSASQTHRTGMCPRDVAWIEPSSCVQFHRLVFRVNCAARQVISAVALNNTANHSILRFRRAEAS